MPFGIPLLHPESLLGLFERNSVKKSPLLDFFPDQPYGPAGQSVQYDLIDYGSDVAAVNTRGGQPNAVRPAKRGTVVSNAITLSEKIVLEPWVIKDLRGAGSAIPENVTAHMNKQMKKLQNRINKRKALFAAQALGIASGNLSFTLPNMVSAETVSLGYQTSPTSHVAIGTAWGTASTDILGDIEDAMVKIETDSGKEATHMVLNSTTLKYLKTNTKILSLLNEEDKKALLSKRGTPVINGLQVIVINETYTNEDTGTATKLIPDAHVAILAGDNENRAMLETEPVTLKAPEGHRGLVFHTYEELGIAGSLTIEYEYNFLPLLADPNEVVFDTNVNG